MESYLQWNVVNWITVLVMVAVGMALVGMTASFIRQGLPKVASTA